MKYKCIDCGGSGICIHKKQRQNCKICLGSRICIHLRIKSDCKECGGSNICEHSRIKYRCKDCGGKGICIHGKTKSKCVECGGANLCIHKKEKYICKDCNGKGFCEHGKSKFLCIECNGKSICEHKRRRSKCLICKGSEICKHDKYKEYCKECGGARLCKIPLCETSKSKRYKDYCFSCYVHLFPDEPNSKNYRTKEKTVADFIVGSYIDKTIIVNKIIYDGCSKRRPDIFIDLGEQVIIVEIDECQHNAYDTICENKRLMEISKDIGHRPMVFIRFNPDSYRDKENKLVKTCWTYTKKGLAVVDKPKLKEWNVRLKILKSKIDYWIENKTEKTIEIIKLFYNECYEEFESSDEESPDEEDNVIEHV